MIYKRHAMCNIEAGQVHSTEDRSNYLCCVLYICRHSHSAVGQSQCIAPSLTLFLLFSSPLFFSFFKEENWTKRSSSICSVLYLYLHTYIVYIGKRVLCISSLSWIVTSLTRGGKHISIHEKPPKRIAIFFFFQILVEEDKVYLSLFF